MLAWVISLIKSFSAEPNSALDKANYPCCVYVIILKIGVI